MGMGAMDGRTEPAWVSGVVLGMLEKDGLVAVTVDACRFCVRCGVG